MTQSIRWFALAVTSAAAALAQAAPPPAADAPTKSRTQTVKIHNPMARAGDDTATIAFDVVQLPPGTVTLKAEDGKETEHAIKPVWIGKYEVRWNDYDMFWLMADVDVQERRDGVEAKSRPSKPYSPPDGGYGRDGYPAGCVHFVAAQQYVRWLSRKTGKKFRLPTEAEWEYACRAGGPPVKPDAKALDKAAWFAGNSKEEPHAVGRKEPNAWGLYDMLGNVAEFVIRDPADKEKGIAAGGSYLDEAKEVSSDAREPYSRRWQKSDSSVPLGQGWLPDAHHIGLRVVMEE
jgi:formylglycine-generating enzyme required for sulfatase activity